MHELAEEQSLCDQQLVWHNVHGLLVARMNTQRPVLGLQWSSHGFTLPFVLREGEVGRAGGAGWETNKSSGPPAGLCPGKMFGWEKAQEQACRVPPWSEPDHSVACHRQQQFSLGGRTLAFRGIRIDKKLLLISKVQFKK